MVSILNKLLSTGEGKQIRKYQNIVEKINAFEPQMQAFNDDELTSQTERFRARYAEGESLDELLPEAFATVREASRRTLGLRHFDVQLIGGMALHDGCIAEMKTGEGKTLVSTLAGYLNAIAGQGVHVVTVNEYLAARDSEWMGQIYRFLGMSVGFIKTGMRQDDKRAAYLNDITYGTNAEFGFDYLRDNMVPRADYRTQRGHHYAIVDEVDSILIDEARTPLIISGAGTQAAETYKRFARVIPMLKIDEDFEMEESKKTIAATEEGLKRIENMLGIEDIYSDPSGQLVNHLQQSLRAQFLFKRDVDYVVVDGEVKIVDEFTGRIMEGRRYSEGLHQALEAKEGVLVKDENQTLATITLQNYFRLYEKLAGMTGTAATEDAEFREIYHLPVVIVPSNKPVIREDKNDLIYRTLSTKYQAIVEAVKECHAKGQPVLVGTVSIETSELLSRLLDKAGIKHEVLNAKHHEREAHIVAQAGRYGAVTIATNMAGRGTDILLGGTPEFLVTELFIEQGIDPEEATAEQKATALNQAKQICAEEHKAVVAAGGLAVIGTERHEARRIDNQLRGRSGRQGDPGFTQFYLSLDDDLMRLFGGDRMDAIGHMMERTQMPDDMPIEARMVSKGIENAQRQVEQMHFDTRKNVLEYDDVMNRQRQAIYEERNAILDGKDVHTRVDDIMNETVTRNVEESCSDNASSHDWDWESLKIWLVELTGDHDIDPQRFLNSDEDIDEMEQSIFDYLRNIYQSKEDTLGEERMRQLEQQVMLRIMDTRWMAHLQDMDYLKSGIGLRAYGQRDPLVEYKNEAHAAFGMLRDTMYEDYIRTVLRIQIVQQPLEQTEESEQLKGALYSAPDEAPASVVDELRARQQLQAAAQATHAAGEPVRPAHQKAATVIKDKEDPFANVGRNDLCPCGSGKKYKKCHGASTNNG